MRVVCPCSLDLYDHIDYLRWGGGGRVSFVTNVIRPFSQNGADAVYQQILLCGPMEEAGENYMILISCLQDTANTSCC